MVKTKTTWISHAMFEQLWEDGEPVGTPRYIKGWCSKGSETKKRVKKAPVMASVKTGEKIIR